MTFEKQMRETKKRQKAAEKRADRRRQKEGEKPKALPVEAVMPSDPAAPSSEV